MARRTFEVHGSVDDEGVEYGPDRQELLEIVEDLVASTYRLGGMFTVAPVRRELSRDQFETVAWRVSWDSFAPAERKPKLAAVPPEADPVEVAVAADPIEDEDENAPVAPVGTG